MLQRENAYTLRLSTHVAEYKGGWYTGPGIAL